MDDNKDELILARAKEIRGERGGSLTDAMIQAEHDLTPPEEIALSFTIEVHVKKRVSRWITQVFTPTDTHTTEERLAAYVSTVLNRARVTSIRFAEEAPDIGEGGAVTMRRAQFQEKAPKS